MKIVQKNLMHKGYMVLNNGSFIPLWTEDLVREAEKYKIEPSEIYGVFATNEENLPEIVREIKTFKNKYGIIPQNLTGELRTGFSFIKEIEVPYYYK